MQTSLKETRRGVVTKCLLLTISLLMLQGCTSLVVGAVVGTATTLAVETVKVPFKVTGAVIDVVSDDDDES